MTTTSKVGIGIALIAVIALIAFSANRIDMMDNGMNDEAVLPTSQTDTSDDALLEDAAAIDTELEGLGDDSAAVDASLDADSEY